MKPLRADQIRGTWATILLPINADDSIDWIRLREQVDVLVASGIDGIYTNGSAGEFWTQSEPEFDRLSALIAERCQAAGMAFQIGASHPCLQISLDRIRRSRDLGPGAFQVILPDWWPPSPGETLDLLRRLADAAAPTSLVLYNPPHAKCRLSPADFGVLERALPELAGIKVMDGDEAWYANMRSEVRRLSIFVPGHRLATGRQRGAHGSYSNMACLNPDQAADWNRMMLRDPEHSLTVETQLRNFMQEAVLPLSRRGLSDMALDKLLAAVGGWAETGTRLRWPYTGATDADVDLARSVAERWIPDWIGSGRSRSRSRSQ